MIRNFLGLEFRIDFKGLDNDRVLNKIKERTIAALDEILRHLY